MNPTVALAAAVGFWREPETSPMTLPMLVIAILPALLVAAAMFDLSTFTIPNVLPAAMLVLFIAFLVAMALSGRAMGWDDTGSHLLAGGLALAAGIGLFAAGWVGGGDAKLFAMCCLWLGLEAMLPYAILASLLGGALTLALLTLRRIPLPPLLAAQPWLLRLADPNEGVPYGVALATAALVILPDTEIFRLAAAS